MSLTVAQDHVVSLTYRLTVAGNAVEDGTIDYLHGHGNIVPGLEAGLDGATLGQELHVEVPPALGYGDRVEDAVQQVPRSLFPAGMEIQPGMQFHARAPDGTGVPVWVLHVDDSFIVVDANHPMAGATLTFDVTIRAIRPGTAEEIAHGHMHGPDGHGHGHDH
ncbi:MAG: hypothetical protein RLZZ299_2753 [Pseudomonadota bacterium]|jgi:FKBP-type peptidyl-prolyl cis-trans isomerase SlyD